MVLTIKRALIITTLLAALFTVACGPTDEELAALVAAEVERQVALVPPAPQGDTGPEGPQGPQGAEGSQGLTGPQGPQGLLGPRGPQGATGPQGSRGDTGRTGPQGPRGDPGPAGQPGAPGAPGTSGSLEIPKTLEVEELIIRGDRDGQYIVIRPGTSE